MKQYFLCLSLTIANLTCLGNLAPIFAKPTATSASSRSVVKTVDLKSAIDQYFKAGRIEKSWFAPKDPPEPEKFDAFRKQALESRIFMLKLYGAYQNVRAESSSKYVATFEKKELGLEFTLDKQGRIAGIAAK
jgi:hypothetical protein